MDKVELDFEFHINGPEAKAESDGLNSSLKATGFSAEEAAKKLINSFNPALGLLEQLENEAKQLKLALKEATSGTEIDAYRAKLTQITELQKKLSKGLDDSANKAKGSFNGLQNSINQLSRELPAFTFSAQTGFLAMSNNLPILFDEIGRLKKQNQELTASGQKGVPVWRQLISSLFSWGTAMSVGVTLLTIYGKEIGNLIVSLLKGKEAFNSAKESIALLNKAIESTDFKKAIVSIDELRINIDLAKKGLIDKKDVLEQYNSTIGKTTGQVQSLDEAEKAMVKNADAYVKMTLYKAAAQLALEEAAKKTMEAELSRRKKLEDFGDSFLDASVTNIRSKDQYVSQQANIKANRERRKQEEIKIATDAEKALEEIGKNFQEKAAKISSENNFDFFGKSDDKAKEAERLAKKAKAEMDKILAERKSLMEKISDIDAEYLRKSYSKDEEELLALKDKFAKIRELVEEFNKKNPKKAISLTEFDMVEGIAQEDLLYRQDTEKIKLKLDRDKKLYEDFEAYKTSLGETKAKERFASQIDTQKSFLQKLQADYAVTYAQALTGGFNGAIGERLNGLKKSIEAEQTVQQKKQEDLLKSLQSYEKERSTIIQNYNVQRASLDTVKNADEIAELDRQEKEKLAKLDDSHVQQLSAYKALYESLEGLSVQQVKKVVNDAKVMLNALVSAGLISTDLAKKIGEKIKESDKTIGSAMPQKLTKLAGELNAIASSVSAIDAEFAKVLSTLGNVIGEVANIKKGFTDLKTAQASGSTFGQLSAGLGIIGAGFSIFQSIFKLFDKSQQREEQANYALELRTKQNDALNKTLERQVALINDVYGTDRIVKYSQALRTAAENQAKFTSDLQGKFLLTGDKEMDALITAMNRGDKTSQGMSLEALYKKNKAYFDALKIKDGTIEELSKLLDSGKLDANTASIVSNLIEAKKAAVELVNQLNAERVGTSLETIADNFINTLLDGTQDWGKSFEEIARRSLLNMFKGELIRKSLQPFYDEYAKLAQDGLTNDELAALNKMYGAAFEKAKQDAAELERITGIKLSDPAASGGTSKGGSVSAKIQDAVSEQTGTEIVGAARAAYDMSKQNVAATRENTALTKEIQAISAESLEVMRQQLLLQHQTQINTANAVGELKNAVVELKQINQNSKTQGARAIT